MGEKNRLVDLVVDAKLVKQGQRADEQVMAKRGVILHGKNIDGIFDHVKIAKDVLHFGHQVEVVFAVAKFLEDHVYHRFQLDHYFVLVLSAYAYNM